MFFLMAGTFIATTIIDRLSFRVRSVQTNNHAKRRFHC